METSQIYILISIIILLIIAILMIFIVKKNKNKKQKQLTPLVGLALAFILSAIIFGESRLVSYSLIGIGVLLAVIDIILNLKKK